MRRTWGSIAFVLTAALLLPGKAIGQSLDDELMKDLGGDPVEQLDREVTGEDAKPADAGLPDDMKKRLERELGAAAEKEDDDPLLRIARQMRAAGQSLERRESRQAGQQQQTVLDELEKLIAQAKKNCKSGACQASGQCSARTPVSKPSACQSSSPKAAKNPGEKQSDRASSSPKRQVDPAEMQALIKRLWGHLPPSVREQVLQPLGDEFVPKYEEMIEDYYRRLAEEK